jgi:aspartyl-tRNA(Asn)/glutamyl-tRNA(Gln) amidotransferase subunit A
MKEELISMSAHELVEHFRRRSLSPVEVMHDVLEAVESLDPVVNCLCALDGGRTATRAVRSTECRCRSRT